PYTSPFRAFDEGLAVGCPPAVDRAAFAILRDHARGGEEGGAPAVVEPEPRAQQAAIVSRHVRPAVPVDVAAFLAVVAPDRRPGPWPRSGQPSRRVQAPQGGGVQEDLLLVASGPARDQVDDPSESGGPVQRGGDALDPLHLS